MVDHWTIERLALLAGAGPARAMLVAAETYGGEDAERLGLVQRMGDLDDALGWADEISALAPLTIAGHKLALNRLEMPVGQGSDEAVRAASETARQSADPREGIEALPQNSEERHVGKEDGSKCRTLWWPI